MKILTMNFDGFATKVCYEKDGDNFIKTYGRNMSIDEVKADLNGTKKSVSVKKTEKVEKKKSAKNKSKKKAEKEIFLVDGAEMEMGNLKL